MTRRPHSRFSFVSSPLASTVLVLVTATAVVPSAACSHKKDTTATAASASASAVPTAPPPDESGKVSLDLSHAPLDPKNAPKPSPSAPKKMPAVLPDEPGTCKGDNDCPVKEGEGQICCIQPADNHHGPELGCQSKHAPCKRPCMTDSDCPVRQSCQPMPGGLLGCGF